jgi:4-amino-4-deoxy-L-arabinose transferase-like glycosyltransferase
MPDSPNSGRTLHVWLLFASAALITLHVWSLTRFPAVFVDEAWFGSRAWSFLQSGDPIGTLDHGVVDRFSGSSHFFQFLPMLGQALSLWAAGGVSLAALRAFSLVMGALLCASIWWIAKAWYDDLTALISVVLLAISGPFIYSSHLARYDVAAAALGYAAIATYVVAGRTRRFRAVAAGILAGLALEFHPFALSIVVALPALAVEEFGRQIVRLAVPRLLGLGLCLGLAIYPAIHVLPDPAGYAQLSRIIYGPTHTPSLTQLGTGVTESLRLTIRSFGVLTPLLIFAVLTLGTGRRRGDRPLGVAASVIFVAFTVLVRNKLPYYAILLTPALTLCVAVLVVRVVRVIRLRDSWSLPSLSGALVLAGLISFSAWISLRALRQDGRPAFADAVNQLKNAVRPGERILGSQTYWFGLSNHPYYSWEQIIYLQRLQPGLSVGGALTALRPDVFVRDDHMDWFILDRPGSEPYTRLLWLPKAELESWLATHSIVESDVVNPLYGRIRIYRIHWEDVGPRPGTAPTEAATESSGGPDR